MASQRGGAYGAARGGVPGWWCGCLLFIVTACTRYPSWDPDEIKGFDDEDYGGEELEEDGTTRDLATAEPLYGVEPGPAPIVRKLETASTRPADADEVAAVRRLMAEAERTRKLAFLAPVDVYVQDANDMQAFVRSQIDPGRARRAFERYRALDMLPADASFEELLKEAEKVELLGYYDPEQKRLVLRTEVAYSLKHHVARRDSVEWRSVVLHELVHALQDQHFNLGPRIKRPRSTDAQHAFMAVMEGDATLAMLHFMTARVGIDFNSLIDDVDTLDQLMHQTSSVGVASLAAPIEEQPGMFRYQAGVLFAASAVVDGTWDDLNHALRQPPGSTHEVLEPDRYFAHWHPRRVRLPAFKALARAGYRRLHEDTLGRIELGAYLRRGSVAADAAAREWMGDRIAVFRHGEQLAALWVIAFDQPWNAERAAQIANEGFQVAGNVERKPSFAYHYAEYAIIGANIAPGLRQAVEAELRHHIDSKAIRGRR